MALGTPTDGGAAYSAAGGTTVAPAYPASIASGDCLVLIVGMKPSTANGGTIGTAGAITGWTQREAITAQGGYGTTLGADQGNTNLWIYTKDTVAGTETGNLTVTVGTNNVAWGLIVRIPSGVGSFSYGTADGTRDTAPTSGTAFTTLLTNGTTAPNFQNGDMAIWAMCIPTDVLNNGFTVPTISSTGTTFGTAVELEEPDSGNGNDIGGYVAYAAATAGSSTAAPTVGVTATGTVTNVRGPIALIRAREVLTPLSGSMSVTETGTDAFSAAGDVIVKGSGAASETGADAFAGNGTVANAGVSGSMAATETGSDTLAGSGKVIVRGSLSVTETGTDSFSANGFITAAPVVGSMAATETGNDIALASGKVLVSGSLAANEAGEDAFLASGKVLVTGSLSATEVGEDVYQETGVVLVSGAMAATEAGNDTFFATGLVSSGVTGVMHVRESDGDQIGGYVLDGYVNPGYVETGIFGFVRRVLPANALPGYWENMAGRAKKKPEPEVVPEEYDEDVEVLMLLVA